MKDRDAQACGCNLHSEEGKRRSNDGPAEAPVQDWFKLSRDGDEQQEGDSPKGHGFERKRERAEQNAEQVEVFE